MATPTRQNSLSMQSSAVALAPARALTSHARKAYEKKYRGQFRFPKWVFGFDLGLIIFASALLTFDAALLIHSVIPMPSGLSATLSAPTLRTAEDIPLTLTVRVTDGRVHEAVSLRWRLPEWVEIMRAEPPIGRDGTVFFGDIRPDVTHHSVVVARIRALPGVQVPIGYTLLQSSPFGFRYASAERETRKITESGITAGAEYPIVSVAPGAILPMQIQTSETAHVDSAAFRIIDGSATVLGDSSVSLGAIAPSSTRVVFVEGGTEFSWQLEDRARIIAASTETYRRDDTEFPMVARASLLRDGRISLTTDVAASHEARVLTFIEGEEGIVPDEIVEVVPGVSTHTFQISSLGRNVRWYAIPLIRSGDGWRVGLPVVQSLTPRVPFVTEARYYSANGDQIGVGPLTPTVGESTRYWIVWSIDPGSAGLRDVTLRATLPPDAVASGQFASTISGNFAAQDGEVEWSIPSVAPTADRQFVTFAFEAVLSPTQSQEDYTFIGQSTLEALDGASGAAVFATTESDTTLR